MIASGSLPRLKDSCYMNIRNFCGFADVFKNDTDNDIDFCRKM